MVTESRLDNLGEAGIKDSHAISIQTLLRAQAQYLIGRSQIPLHLPP